MMQCVETTIREQQLIPAGINVLAGVSGGADSMALLHVLHQLQRRLKFSLSAVHVHHGLRGKDADRDADAVRDACTRLGVPFYLKCVRVKRGRGKSLEMAAREARHAAFAEAMAATGAAVVAVAHHTDDQAETVLMRLLTGTGADGAGGMDYGSTPRPDLRLIRPLLDVSRDEIEQYLRRHRIPWREDATNRDPAMLRNRIRHRVLPFLAREGFPHASQSLVRFANIMRAEEQERQLQMDACYRNVCRQDRLSISKLRKLPLASQRRVLKHWMGRARDVDFAVIERLRKKVIASEAGRMMMARGSGVIWAAGWLKRMDAGTPDHAKPAGIPATPLRTPGITVTADGRWQVEITATRGFKKTRAAVGKFPVHAYLRREEPAPALLLRSRKAGDRITPTGMPGTVSIKQLLIDQKVPAAERGQVPLIVAGDHVVWVAGYRISRDWAVASSRAPSWRIKISR